MRQTRWTILFVALCVAMGSFVSQAAAQNLPNFVAVVDVAQLIKAHPDFQKKQDALKAEMQGEEAKFRQRQEMIVKKEKTLQDGPYKQGTAEYQKLMDEIANDYADFDKDAKQRQRKFALQNSQIMFDTYQDIKATIGTFATARRIAQVTDYRVFEPNPLEPQTVAEDMDQKLVWFDKTLDITELVIAEMYKARNLPVPQRTATPGAPATR